MQIDKGAIPHVLKGSDIYAPGLVSAGGKIQENVKIEEIVAIYSENKQHALGVGQMLMSSQELLEEDYEEVEVEEEIDDPKNSKEEMKENK